MRIVRIAPGFVRTVIAVSYLAVAVPALAQDSAGARPSTARAETVNLPRVDLATAPARVRLQAQRQQSLFPPRDIVEPRRPGALLPLYGSLVALQGLDLHSTRRAIESGAGREANPAMREVVQHGAAFVAVKAGATAGVIWASEKMWKKNRKAAVIFTSLVNIGMAAIVANNYRVSR